MISMAKCWAYLLIGIASLTLVTAQEGNEVRQLTGQEVFCLNLARECPDNLLQGPICASTANNFPNECEFWRENCRRKSVQRMSLVSREPCSDEYCPEHCRGEVKDYLCANYINTAGALKEKTYRNYCKFREAKCKQRNVYEIELNFLYYGECGFPKTTAKPTVVTTATKVPSQRELEVTTSLPEEFDETTFVTAVQYDDGTLSTETEATLSPEELGRTPSLEEIAGTTIIFEMEETIVTDDMNGTLSPDEEMDGTLSPEEIMEGTTILFEVDETVSPENVTEGTQSPDEVEGTPSTEEETEGTQSPDEIMEGTTLLFGANETLSTEDVTEGPETLEGTEGTVSPDETDGTLSPEDLEVTSTPEVLEGTEGTASPDETEGTLSPEEMEVTSTPEVLEGTEGTASPDETEGTLSPDEMEGTTLLVEFDGTGTPSPDEIEGTPSTEGTISPEDLEGTPAPEVTSLPTPSLPDEDEALVDVLRQCLAEYQSCFDEIPSTDDTLEMIGLFFQCTEGFQNCLGEDALIAMAGMDKEPELGPSK